MEWLEVSIQTVSSAIEQLADALTASGYDSFIIDDTQEFQSFLQENTQYWDYVEPALAEKMAHISQIRLYLPKDAQAPGQLAAIQEVLERFRTAHRGQDVGTLEIGLEGLQEEDWENSWKQYYQPIAVGRRLLVVPQWLHPENPEGRIPLLLDPGMIFGTGAHASTQMCMQALENVISGGETVVDLGSGSGILSIAALLLGAKQAVGVDIDPKAQDIAKENAALNGLTAPRFQAVTGNVIADETLMRQLSREPYDVVLANIVADVIIPLSEAVPKLLKPDGVFICSGILNTRLGDVVDALDRAGLKVQTKMEQDDWCCLTAALKQRAAN